eukprot:TRINITY_DN27740_c0_g1_i1.p1 TRINITY_DN27740_c0_g1~~TRINITY_DN27740_c0_g1_i1.p1  ORF type:complete len:968 (-),score=327.35 TRINITY_DN27740_c0_g1_i1:180-3083(-)
MDDYQEFLLTVRRDINCLSDGDRAVRRGAIVRLEKTLFSAKASKDFAKRLFMEELHKPLFKLFGDQTEKCRELSMAMTTRYIDIIEVDALENLLPLLLAALLGRFRILPFPEQSEELRLEALKLLSHLFDTCKARLDPFAGDIVDALAKALTDTAPEAKKECCAIVKKVSLYFNPERVSNAGGALVTSLCSNLKHQQWKVRKATLDSLAALLSHEATMLDHLEEVLPQLGALLGDRTSGVRQALAEALEKWLSKGIDFKAPMLSIHEDDGQVGFDKFEHRLLLLYLSCVADEDTAQVAPVAFAGLEKIAVLKQEARKRHAERARDKAMKMREATKHREGNGGYTEAGPGEKSLTDVEGIKDPEPVPAFDYSSVAYLLPEPFAASGSSPGRIPAPLTSTYVLLHLPSILPQVLGNLTQWTADIRGSAARLLRVLLVIVNRQVAPFLDQVLVHLYKATTDDDQMVARSTLQCAAMVGAFLDIELVLALVAKHLGVKGEGGRGEGTEDLWPEQQKGRQTVRTVAKDGLDVRNFTATNVENKRQVLAVLAHLLPPASSPGAAAVPPEAKAPKPKPLPKDAVPRLQLPQVKTVLKFLEDGAASEDLLPWVFEVTMALMASAAKMCVEEWPRVFDLLLRMRSGEECESAAVDGGMDILAELCGRSRRELYEEHLQARLAELLQNADMVLWEERSANRHVMETLLRNAGPAAAPHIARLIPALARQASPEDACVPARVDILGLVHFLVSEQDATLTAAIQMHSAALLDSVLLPNCTWKAGQSNNKIRKGGLICVHVLLQRHLVSAETLNAVFADLLPVLKSCLDDSFSPDNRLIACLVLSATLSELQAVISSDQLREVYPELLKRLDDSNDKIRTAICEALATFFKCLPPKWSRTLFEYILRTLFVHLDDPNLEIQQGVYAALEAAVHQDYTTFIAEAKTAAGKSAHPRLCEELARLAESLRQSADFDDEDGMN